MLVVGGDVLSLYFSHVLLHVKSEPKRCLPGADLDVAADEELQFSTKKGMYCNFPLGLAINNEVCWLTSVLGNDCSFNYA